MDVAAIVLAGGQSRRMGQPKANLKFGELRLLDLIVGRLRKAFREIVVVLPPAPVAQVAPSDPGVTVVHDPVPFHGPLVGIKRGLEEILHDRAFVCSCDLPMFSVMVATGLVELLGDYEAVIPEVHGIAQPLHAVYRKRCIEPIDQLLRSGERRAIALGGVLKAHVIGENHLRLLDPGLTSFISIDTPDEYLAALQMGGFPRPDLSGHP